MAYEAYMQLRPGATDPTMMSGSGVENKNLLGPQAHSSSPGIQNDIEKNEKKDGNMYQGGYQEVQMQSIGSIRGINESVVEQ